MLHLGGPPCAPEARFYYGLTLGRVEPLGKADAGPLEAKVLVENVGLVALETRGQGDSDRAFLTCPIFNNRRELRPDPPVLKAVADHQCRQPGDCGARMNCGKHVAGNEPDHASIELSNGDRSRLDAIESRQSFADLDGSRGIAENAEQLGDGFGIVRRGRSNQRRR